MLSILAAAALAAQGSPLRALAETVNARGAALRAEDLAPLFAPFYIKDGFGPAEGAAECATVLRGTRLALTEDGRLSVETAGGALVKDPADDRHTLCSLARVAEGRFVGNGLPARALVHASLTDKGRSLRLLVSAPPGRLAEASASWGGRTVSLAKRPGRVREVRLEPRPGTPLDVWAEHFVWELPAGEPYPEPGTAVEFSFAGAQVARTVPALPEAPARIVVPEGTSLADARLGRPLRVAWEYPAGFTPVSVELVGLLRAGSALCEVDTEPPLLPAAATAAVMRLPERCAGRRVRPRGPEGDPPAALTLQAEDAQGRMLEVFHEFR